MDDLGELCGSRRKGDGERKRWVVADSKLLSLKTSGTRQNPWAAALNAVLSSLFPFRSQCHNSERSSMLSVMLVGVRGLKRRATSRKTGSRGL